MLSFKLKGLRERRGAIQAELRGFADRIDRERRGLTTDEKAKFDQLKVEFGSVSESIKNCESALSELDGSFSGGAEEGDERSIGRGNYDGRARRGNSEDGGAEVGLAFAGWARSQHSLQPTQQQARACRSLGIDPRQSDFVFRLDPRRRMHARSGMATTSTAAGGGFVARSFASEFERAMTDFSGVRGACAEFRTDTGATLDFPVLDDTANDAEITAEASEVAFADPTVSTVQFGSYKYGSGILISAELLQDSEFPLDAEAGAMLGERIGRKQGPHFTTGTGTGQPQGIVTASALGITTAGATAITPLELTRLTYSVDTAYHSGSSVGYMAHPTIIAYLLSLTDDMGRPIYRQTFQDGVARLVVNGFPVWPNVYMAAANTTTGLPVTGTKSVLFGDMSKHKVRDAGEVRLRRLVERYAEKDQVGFVGFLRSDSRCVNANAIKHLLQA